MRASLFLGALLAALITVPPAAAQTVVTSDKTEAVSVTLYRDPTRGQGPIVPNWPGGYALITETRTIAVPAGPAIIRFVGVSQGMLPESAIVTGLPRGVKEKNRDARLLSPAALVDAYLKRHVTIRRTNRKTGKVTVEDALIESGPKGGVLLTTAAGVEALGCSGLPEKPVYPGVPEGLSARPMLSVVTDSPSPARVTVQLSYLAQGFDWSANYVARIAPDGETLDLFAWLTVANGGSEGFAGAHTQAVAGGLHREAAAVLPRGPAPDLHLSCWPMDITSTHPKLAFTRLPWPELGDEDDKAAGYDIVVTGSLRRGRVASPVMAMAAPPPPPPPPPPMIAQQEELGDLKLYRIPEPVTVAAQSRKQVAMIDRHGVNFERIYTGQFAPTTTAEGKPDNRPSTIVLRMKNEVADGLGLPLPAGAAAVFERMPDGQSLLLGESNVADRATGEEIELGAGTSADLRYTVIAAKPSRKLQPYTVRVTNARATPETFEIALPGKIAHSSAPPVERKGRKYWRVLVPANGEAVFAVDVKTR